MGKLFKITFIFASLVFSFVASHSYSAVNLTIDDQPIIKTKIMIYGWQTNNPELKDDLALIVSRIKKNLEGTDLFEITHPNLAPSLIPIRKTDQNNNSDLLIDQIPDFDKYNALGISALLIADVGIDKGGNNLELKIRLWDILDERQLFGKFYSASRAHYKKMANVISDEIFKVITGEKQGHFNSQIVYIAESGNILERTKRVAMIDFDGENQRYLTDGDDLVLTPIFAKNPGHIIFLRYYNDRPQLYELNIKSKILAKIGGYKNTSFAPAAHPGNSNLILLSMIDNGNSDVYEFNFFTGRAARLTFNPAIDTTPSYSPDGKQIVFISDREGNPAIYMMDADGGSLRKISRDRAIYSKPVWSPNANLIAFTKVKDGKFGIGLMGLDGRNEKILTTGFIVEGARWSPDGRYLIYSRKNSAYGTESIPRLYIIDVTTGFEREIPTPENEGATDPDWALIW